MKTIRVTVEFKVLDKCPDNIEMVLTDHDVLDGFDFFNVETDHHIWIIPETGRIVDQKRVYEIDELHDNAREYAIEKYRQNEFLDLGETFEFPDNDVIDAIKGNDKRFDMFGTLIN